MFLDYLRNDEKFEAAAPRLRRGAGAYAPSFYAPYVLAAALADGGARVVVAPDGEAATRLAADLSVYLDRAVPVLPARGVLYGADVAPSPHVVGERQQALSALAAGGVVVVEAVALLERFLPLELQPRPLTLAPREEIDFDAAVARLAALGYERIEQVRARGEFAVRGGLIDVYPALGDPLRVEFWGDEVERLRTFSIYSQRTTGEIPLATVFAAFEADTSQPEYVNGLHQAVADWEREGREETPEELERRAAVRALAALAGRFTTLGELAASADLGWAVFNPDETYRALADFDAEVTMAVPGAGLRERLYAPLADARALLAKALHMDVVQRDQPIQFAASRPQFAARDIGSAERDLIRLVNDDYRVFIVFRHEGEAERATYRLRNISAETVTPEQLARLGEAGPGLYFVAAPLREGFVSEDLKLAVVNERALIRSAPRERRFAAGTRLTTFFDVRPGDFVVHEDHGVARFAGIETRTVAGVTRDYLLLEFRGDDRVFVPHDQIGKVSRYIGASGASPSLDKLGGTHWQTVKTRARTAVVEMAGELLQLYAARQAIPGFGFPPDGELMRRLEDSFPLRGDRRPGGGHRRGQERHGGAAPHGPPHLRRRRLRQDRGRAARGVQGGRGRQAEPGPGPHDHPRRAALDDLRGALRRPAGQGRHGLPVPQRRRAAQDARRLHQGGGRRARGDAPAAEHGRASQGTRPRHRRRGAALRRASEGGAAQPQAAGGRREPLGHADPAHPPDEPERHPRHLGDRDRAARPPRDPHLHRRVQGRPGPHRHREGAGARGPGVLPAQPRGDDRPGGRARARARARRARAGRARADGRARAREGHAGVPRRRGRRAGDDVDHRERHRHPDGQHARRGARRHARSGAAVPDPRAHRAQRRARLRLPALSERRPADERGGGAADRR